MQAVCIDVYHVNVLVVKVVVHMLAATESVLYAQLVDIGVKQTLTGQTIVIVAGLVVKDQTHQMATLEWEAITDTLVEFLTVTVTINM